MLMSRCSKGRCTTRRNLSSPSRRSSRHIRSAWTSWNSRTSRSTNPSTSSSIGRRYPEPCFSRSLTICSQEDEGWGTSSGERRRPERLLQSSGLQADRVPDCHRRYAALVNAKSCNSLQHTHNSRSARIKGNRFTIPGLLGVAPKSEEALMFENGSVAICRLAPQDYHRFHSPIDGVVGDTTDIPGQYYTGMSHQSDGSIVLSTCRSQPAGGQRARLRRLHREQAFGALHDALAVGCADRLRSYWCYAGTYTRTRSSSRSYYNTYYFQVGSIAWTNGGKKGQAVRRGEELGYFAYGGSTIVVLFPKGLVE